MMKNTLKISIVSILIFTLIIFFACLLSNVASKLKGDSDTVPSDLENNEYTVQESAAASYLLEEDEAAQVKTLTVDWPSGMVELYPTQEKTIAVYLRSGDSGAAVKKDTVSFEVKDEELIIKDNTSQLKMANMLNLQTENTVCSIAVPEEQFSLGKCEISVNTADADIHFAGLSANTVRLQSVSGDILFSEAYVKTAELVSASGAIEVNGCILSVLECSTISGRITSTAAAGDVALDSVSGEISYTAEKMFERADVNTISGEIQFILTENEGFRISLSRASGELSSDFPLTFANNFYLYGEGRIPINISTASGNISIERE